MRLIIIFIVLILAVNLNAQMQPFEIDEAQIDSLLSRYHLEGVKIFVKKLGVISIKEKTVALERSEIDNKLLITLQKSLSLDESGFGAKFDYLIQDHWVLRGETYRKNWGQQSGVSILYRMEY